MVVQKENHYHPHKSSLSEEMLDKIRTRPIGDKEGFKIFLVDGEKIRGSVDVDFTMGGNGARYDYVPEDEIWIDQNLGDKDREVTIDHEITEFLRMKLRGESYDKAHDNASILESIERTFLKKNESGLFLVVAVDGVTKKDLEKLEEGQYPKVKQNLESGADFLTSWISEHGGEWLEKSLSRVLALIPQAALDYLPMIQDYYKSITGLTLSIGVGWSKEEADKSVAAAGLLGGKTILFYGNEVEDTLKDNSMRQFDSPEVREIYERLLSKNEELAVFKDEETPEVTVKPEEKPKADPSYAEEFHKLAEKNKPITKVSDQSHHEIDLIKERLTSVLKTIMSKMPEVERMQKQNPDMYHLLWRTVQMVKKMAESIHKVKPTGGNKDV